MRKKAPITITAESRSRAVAALREYADENLDEPMGDLKAGLLFDFMLTEFGPTIYNQAIADARAFIEERAADLDAALHHAEFPKSTRSRRDDSV